MKRIIPVLLIFACLASCEEVRNNQSDLGTPTWDSLTYEKEFLYLDSVADGPKYNISFNIQHPVGETLMDSKLDSIITGFLFSKSGVSVKDAMENFTDSLVTSFKEEMAEFYDPHDEFPSQFEYSYDLKGSLVDGCRENVIGYQMQAYTYLGGAHGSYSVFYQNIDATSGSLLRAADVFDLSRTDEILNLIVEQLIADNGCSSREELTEKTDILMLGEPYVSDVNFILMEDGVAFLYNQYEIACYAAGTIQTKVSYDKINDYMTWK